MLSWTQVIKIRMDPHVSCCLFSVRSLYHWLQQSYTHDLPLMCRCFMEPSGGAPTCLHGVGSVLSTACRHAGHSSAHPVPRRATCEMNITAFVCACVWAQTPASPPAPAPWHLQNLTHFVRPNTASHLRCNNKHDPNTWPQLLNHSQRNPYSHHGNLPDA